MLTIDQLFLHTLDDLEERVPLGRGEYDALMCGWLLRKLLLDGGHSLIDMANRPSSRNLRLQYEVVDKPRPESHGWLLNGMLYPGDSPPRSPTVALTRDQFLALPTLKALGETITVRELIKFSADRLGAVHFIHPKGGKEEALWEFMRDSSVTGPRGKYSLGISDLAAIGKIVLAGVTELRERVEREIAVGSTDQRG
jgi:hypothetical protein